MTAANTAMNNERGNDMAKGFRVLINDEEYEFVKKLAKYDGMTVHNEINVLLSLQIREEIELEQREHRFT